MAPAARAAAKAAEAAQRAAAKEAERAQKEVERAQKAAERAAAKGTREAEKAERAAAKAERAAAKAAAQAAKEAKRAAAFEAAVMPTDARVWVQCDKCDKWRVLPPGVHLDADAEWYCEMHPDRALASCDVPEDSSGTDVWVVGEAERARRSAGALAAAEAEGLSMCKIGSDSYAHVFPRPSLHGTPFVAAVPLDRHGRLQPTASIHVGPGRSLGHRELGQFATPDEAALVSARFVSEYKPDLEALLKALLSDESGEPSRTTLKGQVLDFYWPMDDVWCASVHARTTRTRAHVARTHDTHARRMHHAAHAAHAARVHARAHKHVSTCCTWRRYDATCIGPAEGSTTYTFEWNDDGKIEELDLAQPLCVWRMHREGESGQPSLSRLGRGPPLMDLDDEADLHKIAAAEELALELATAATPPAAPPLAATPVAGPTPAAASALAATSVAGPAPAAASALAATAACEFENVLVIPHEEAEMERAQEQHAIDLRLAERRSDLAARRRARDRKRRDAARAAAAAEAAAKAAKVAAAKSEARKIARRACPYLADVRTAVAELNGAMQRTMVAAEEARQVAKSAWAALDAVVADRARQTAGARERLAPVIKKALASPAVQTHLGTAHSGHEDECTLSVRGTILRALYAGASERCDIYETVSLLNDEDYTASPKQKTRIVTPLGKEKVRPEPMWVQKGDRYQLTMAGENALKACKPLKALQGADKKLVEAVRLIRQASAAAEEAARKAAERADAAAAAADEKGSAVVAAELESWQSLRGHVLRALLSGATCWREMEPRLQLLFDGAMPKWSSVKKVMEKEAKQNEPLWTTKPHGEGGLAGAASVATGGGACDKREIQAVLQALQHAEQTCRQESFEPVDGANGWRMRWAWRGAYFRTPEGKVLRSFAQVQRWMEEREAPEAAAPGAARGASNAEVGLVAVLTSAGEALRAGAATLLEAETVAMQHAVTAEAEVEAEAEAEGGLDFDGDGAEVAETVQEAEAPHEQMEEREEEAQWPAHVRLVGEMDDEMDDVGCGLGGGTSSGLAAVGSSPADEVARQKVEAATGGPALIETDVAEAGIGHGKAEAAEHAWHLALVPTQQSDEQLAARVAAAAVQQGLSLASMTMRGGTCAVAAAGAMVMTEVDALLAEFDRATPRRGPPQTKKFATLSNGWKVMVYYNRSGYTDRRSVTDANGYVMTKPSMLRERLEPGGEEVARQDLDAKEEARRAKEEERQRKEQMDKERRAQREAAKEEESQRKEEERQRKEAERTMHRVEVVANRPRKRKRKEAEAPMDDEVDGDDDEEEERIEVRLCRFRATARYGTAVIKLGDFPTAPIAALCVARNERARRTAAVVAAEDAIIALNLQMAGKGAWAQGAEETQDGTKVQSRKPRKMIEGGGGAAESGMPRGTSAAEVEDVPREVERVLDSNDELGASARWLVKWIGVSEAEASWVPVRKIPRELLAEFEQQRMEAFNKRLEPLLESAPEGSSDASGVVALHVDAGHARACADYLQSNWANGKLKLVDPADGRPMGTCFGYASYGKTLSTHDAKQQSTHTLLVTNALVQSARTCIPGFHEIELQLAVWLQQTFGTVVELFYAHGLRQSPETLRSTGFTIHQDTEDYDFIEYTVVVKLTADEDGEAPSQMRVVGASRHFAYGKDAGAAGAFRARLFHASVAPTSEHEHLKVAFFFRNSIKGERLAKRSLVGHQAANDDELLALRRVEVHNRTYVAPGLRQG